MSVYKTRVSLHVYNAHVEMINIYIIGPIVVASNSIVFGLITILLFLLLTEIVYE